jgi:excinuclease ABC subunit C
MASELRQAPGIGPVRQRQLLQHFTNLAALKAATVEEIAALPGFGRKRAEELQGWLQGRKEKINHRGTESTEGHRGM